MGVCLQLLYYRLIDSTGIDMYTSLLSLSVYLLLSNCSLKNIKIHWISDVPSIICNIQYSVQGLSATEGRERAIQAMHTRIHDLLAQCLSMLAGKGYSNWGYRKYSSHG